MRGVCLRVNHRILVPKKRPSCQRMGWLRRLREVAPEEGSNFSKPSIGKTENMNKLLAALVATLFAGATFAASHAGAPMAAASGAKPAASAAKPAASGAAM